LRRLDLTPKARADLLDIASYIALDDPARGGAS
jgi:plasmid stabilization system protein ParE